MAEQRLQPELERARRRRERRARRAGRGCPRAGGAPAGGSQKAAPVRRRVVEIRHLAERVDGARRDRLGGGEDRRRLVEPRRLRPEEPERRSPVDDDRRPGRFLREVLADDELVRPAGGREPRGRGPVDPRDMVARPVRPRADDLVTLAAADAPVPPERAPTKRRRGTSGKVRAAATTPARSGPRPSPAAASGARARQASQITRPSCSRSSVSASTAKSTPSTSRWPTTGSKSRSTSAGTT